MRAGRAHLTPGLVGRKDVREYLQGGKFSFLTNTLEVYGSFTGSRIPFQQFSLTLRNRGTKLTTY